MSDNCTHFANVIFSITIHYFYIGLIEMLLLDVCVINQNIYLSVTEQECFQMLHENQTRRYRFVITH